MFPIAIIAGVIGAVVSTAQGASWVSNHLDSSKAAASAGGKGEAKPQSLPAEIITISDMLAKPAPPSVKYA